MKASTIESNEQKKGVINAVFAYLIWGFAPIYFKLIDYVSADEIMVHRVLWSSALLVIIIFISKKTRAIKQLLLQPKLLLKLFITALILATNWFLFIWAVNNDHLLDASLGYYINPLLNVALGMIFLQERLTKWQIVAVVLAIIGVLIQVVSLGTLPTISLALAGTFGVYGLLRKKIAVDTFTGLTIESIFMLPIALIYWQLFIISDSSNLLVNGWQLNASLMFAGVISTAPLLCFTAAAKRITLSTLGFFQYIGPSIMFLLATFYYQEALLPAKLITFAFIWLALLIYSVNSLQKHRNKKSDVKTI